MERLSVKALRELAAGRLFLEPCRTRPPIAGLRIPLVLSKLIREPSACLANSVAVPFSGCLGVLGFVWVYMLVGSQALLDAHHPDRHSAPVYIAAASAAAASFLYSLFDSSLESDVRGRNAPTERVMGRTGRVTGRTGRVTGRTGGVA